MFFNRLLKNRIWELWCLRKYSFITLNQVITKQSIIAIADNSVPKCGGLVDRLKGIISLFHFSVVTNKRFYINYTFPFNLNKYLVPNEYNWEIILDRYPIYQFRTLYLIGEMDGERLFSYKGRRSLLIYSNFNLISQLNARYKTDFSFGELFKILFKPSEMVREKVEYVKNAFCLDNYIAIHFRFQQLLGDFRDTNGDVLDMKGKKKMISDCLSMLNQIQSKHQNMQLLIFSDSSKFIEKCGECGYTVIPGTIGHIDFCETDDVFLKTFVDFYLISEARYIYSVILDQMYPSAFPEYASLLNNVPFQRVYSFEFETI